MESSLSHLLVAQSLFISENMALSILMSDFLDGETRVYMSQWKSTLGHIGFRHFGNERPDHHQELFLCCFGDDRKGREGNDQHIQNLFFKADEYGGATNRLYRSNSGSFQGHGLQIVASSCAVEIEVRGGKASA